MCIGFFCVNFVMFFFVRKFKICYLEISKNNFFVVYVFFWLDLNIDISNLGLRNRI